MRKTIKLMTIMALFATFGLQAQMYRGKTKNPEARQKIMKRKLLYLKENLMLNKQEAKDFEAVYSTYMAEKASLNQSFKEEVVKKLKNVNISELPANEKKQIIENKLKFDKQRYEIERDFTLKLTKILPSDKVIRYFKLDRQFNRELVKRLRERRQKALIKRRKAMGRKQKAMEKRQRALENEERQN